LRSSRVGSQSLLDQVAVWLSGGQSFSLVFLVELHELSQIKLRLLEDFSLVHKHVLERVELGALLSDLGADLFREQLLEEVLE